MIETHGRNFLESLRRRCSSTQKIRKLAICALVTVALYGIYIYHDPSHRIRSYTTKSPSGCETLTVAPPIEDTAAISKLWLGLTDLFDAHKPSPDLPSPGDPSHLPAAWDFDTIKNWLSITPEEMEAMRKMHAELVGKMPAYPENVYKGRGLIYVVGGVYSEYAATSVGMLRLLGSTLPVEMWFKDSAEMKPGWCEEIAQEGIACRLLSDYMDVSNFTQGFQFKSASLFFSSFQEVLYLDADSIPVRNPDTIFDSDPYRQTGVVLWPDLWKGTESPMTGYITGASEEVARASSEVQTVESGEILWDKKRHWRGLCLSSYYNYHGPKYFYTLITQGGPGWGDKDTFPTALRALGVPWHLVPHPLVRIHEDREHTGKGTGTGIAMMQADPASPDPPQKGENETFVPLFMHSNTLKWGVLHFMCQTCPEDPTEQARRHDTTHPGATFRGRYEDPSEGVYGSLTQGKRIMATKNMEGWGIDPEKDMWRVMERVACVGVWRDGIACNRTREYLEKTFGLVQQTNSTATRWGPCNMGD